MKKVDEENEKLKQELNRVRTENLQLKAALVNDRKRIAQLEFAELERTGNLIQGELDRLTLSKKKEDGKPVSKAK